MGGDRTIFICLLIGLFITSFYLGYNTTLSTISVEKISPVEQYLYQHYGVRSVEEYIAKIRAKYSYNLKPLNETLCSVGLPSTSMWLQPNMPSINRMEMGDDKIYTINTSIPLYISAIISLPIILLAIIGLIYKKYRKHLAIIVLCITIFTVGFYSGTLYATPSISKAYISKYSMVQGYSYIIFGEDTDNDGILDIIYCKNGTTGRIDYSGTDASTIIQWAINQLINGRILIRNGVYKLNAPLNITNKNGFEIIGESWYTILKPSGNFGAIIIGSDREEEEVKNILITNLAIDGSSQTEGNDPSVWGPFQTSVGIATYYYARNIIIQNNYLYNTGRDSIYGHYDIGPVMVLNNIIECCRGFWGGIHAHGWRLKQPNTDAHNWYIIGNLIKESYGGGIRHGKLIIGNTIINHGQKNWAGTFAIIGSLESTDNCLIIGNYIRSEYSYARGISAYGGKAIIIGNRISCPSSIKEGIILLYSDYPDTTKNMTKVVVADNYIEGFNYGIYAKNPVDCIFKNNVIINSSQYGIYWEGGNGNLIESNTIMTENGYGIYEATSDNNQILRNKISAPTPIHKTGTNTIIKYNIGFVTENSGVSGGLKDGSYIVHGLAGTPTIVTLTCLNATYDGVPVIVSWDKANTNSTHIAVHIYWSNGTAITNPVIAVSWKAIYKP